MYNELFICVCLCVSVCVCSIIDNMLNMWNQPKTYGAHE